MGRCKLDAATVPSHAPSEVAPPPPRSRRPCRRRSAESFRTGVRCQSRQMPWRECWPGQGEGLRRGSTHRLLVDYSPHDVTRLGNKVRHLEVPVLRLNIRRKLKAVGNLKSRRIGHDKVCAVGDLWARQQVLEGRLVARADAAHRVRKADRVEGVHDALPPFGVLLDLRGKVVVRRRFLKSNGRCRGLGQSVKARGP